MFVRRLTAWFSRLTTSVTGHLRRPTAAPSPRQPVLTGAVDYDHEQRTFSVGSASGRWLDDARRLRPHIVPPLHQAPRWSGKPAASSPSTTGGLPERTTQLPARPLPLLPASTPPALPPLAEPAARTQPLPPKPNGPPPFDLPAVPPAPNSPSSASSAEEADQQLQRRLRSLRFLVRHGVYNEGFPAGAAPEQYHYSLGLDQPESEPESEPDE